MYKEDFKFDKFKPEYQDYYFKVSGETRDQLTREYMEQSMLSVFEVVYSKAEDAVFVRRLFPFNCSTVESKDETLKQLLIEMIDELGDVDGKSVNCQN